jgi:hypothetical protein
LVRKNAWSEKTKMTQHERALPPAPPPPLKNNQIDDKPFDSGVDEEDDVFEGQDNHQCCSRRGEVETFVPSLH